MSDQEGAAIGPRQLDDWLQVGWDLGVLSVFLSREDVDLSYAGALARELLQWAERLCIPSSTRAEIAALRSDLSKSAKLTEAQYPALALKLERITEQLSVHASVSAEHLVPTQVCELDVVKLREGAREFVSNPSCWEGLTEPERNDLDEAALAILAGCPTAATILSLRVVESALRESLSAAHAEVADRAGWGKLLDVLRRDGAQESGNSMRRDTRELLDLLAWLKDVRDSIAHPDQRISQERAEAIFLNVTNDALPTLVGRASPGNK